MGVSWGFVVLVVYPALQVPMLWALVRYVGLRNDDGPRDPVGYSLADGEGEGTVRGGPVAGRCARCGVQNEPIAEYCRYCLSEI